MTTMLNLGPADEPVSLADAKAHLKVDDSNEDQLVQALVTAARAHLELATRRAFLTQSWSLFLDRWPEGGTVALPFGPVQSVDAVRLHDEGGTATTLAGSEYVVDTVSLPARVARPGHDGWPGRATRALNGIEIMFTAGFGAAPGDVPAPLRQAILQLVAHWFEHREPLAFDGAAIEMPAAVKALIAPYRMVSL
mgnify:CR=1 FL=1